MKEHPNPNKTLENVIKDSELPALAKDYTELVIDGVLDDGILKDVPLVGSVIGVMKFGNSLNKHFSAKKIYKFLYELHSIPLDKRIKKIEEINSSKKYQSNVGEIILEQLDKIESDGKPEIIGKLFCAFIEEEINFQTYLRLAHIVNKVFYYDLVKLKESTKNLKLPRNITVDDFFTNGLIISDPANDYEKFKELYKEHEREMGNVSLTYLGHMLVNVGMK